MMTLELANLKLHTLYKQSLDNNTIPSFKLGRDSMGNWEVVVSDVVPAIKESKKEIENV